MCICLRAFAVVILLAGLPSNLASLDHFDFANIPWPADCGNKTYCHQKPDNWGVFQKRFDMLLDNVIFEVTPQEFQNRTEIENDPGHCESGLNNSYIYLIRDENNKVRVVAETEHFKQRFLITECEKAEIVGNYLFTNSNLVCYETKVSVLFNVLSLDGNELDSAAPLGGLPFSCSTKKMKKSSN